MSSPDDRPGSGQSPSPSARAPQIPDPEPPGGPAPHPASAGGAEPDLDFGHPADSDNPASAGGPEPGPEPAGTPVPCGGTEPSGDPGAGAGLDSGPPRETGPGPGAPGGAAPPSGPDAPGPTAPPTRPEQPRPPRSGAELAHLVLVSVLLGTAIMGPIQTLAQIMPNQPSPIPLILNNIILNKSIWLPVGALVLALRRRPTTLSTALALVILLEDARHVPFFGTIPASAANLAPFVPVYLSLALAAAGAVVGALANRSLDGRPIPVTLAGGVCAGALTRSAIDLVPRLYQMLDDDAALLLSARQWDSATFLGLIDVPPGLIPPLTALAAVAAAVGLTGFWSTRGARSRIRLLAGSLAAAVVTIVLAGLFPTSSSALNDLGAGFSPLTALPPVAPVPLLMAGSVALPACGRWFERR